MRLNGLRVLIVEDSTDSRDLLTMMLRVKNIDVRSAGNGAEARQVLTRWRPDVIVSDLGMPEEDGFSMIEKVRASEEPGAPILPAIALSAFADASDRQRALKCGYQKYIAKPGDMEGLLLAIAEVSGRLSA